METGFSPNGCLSGLKADITWWAGNRKRAAVWHQPIGGDSGLVASVNKPVVLGMLKPVETWKWVFLLAFTGMKHVALWLDWQVCAPPRRGTARSCWNTTREKPNQPPLWHTLHCCTATWEQLHQPSNTKNTFHWFKHFCAMTQAFRVFFVYMRPWLCRVTLIPV